MPDEIFLADMLAAARATRRFTDALDRMSFEHDELRQYAVARAIQVIGEAARGISPETRHAHAEIPWQGIIGMRHRLVHDYRAIDVQRVWLVAVRDVPALIAALEPLVPTQ